MQSYVPFYPSLLPTPFLPFRATERPFLIGVNSGVTETENVKSVIFENLEKESEQITLEVSDRIYSELQEGDCASLSYRDGKLISFGALQNRDDRERSFRR